MNFDWSYLLGPAKQLLLTGLLYTVLLTVAAGALSIGFGLVTGTLNWLGVPVIGRLIRFYVSFSRNTPFVVQLLLIYFSIPMFLPTSMMRQLQFLNFEFIVAAVALGWYHGAFFCEVFRSALRGIPPGQFDGSRALGLPIGLSLRLILLPQAIRNALPSLLSELISLSKNTSITVAIGLAELTYQYRYISDFDFRGVEALTVVTVFYIMLCLGISGLGLVAERRFGPLPRQAG